MCFKSSSLSSDSEKAGIPHGPHPGAYENSVGKRATDELAVMLDCSSALRATQFAEVLEDSTYHESFLA